MENAKSRQSRAISAEGVRLNGVDICRSIAIILAMLSHSMAEFGIANFYGEAVIPVRFAMQMAPPIFICLFGAMLELAYCRKVRAGHTLAATNRLLSRSLQCYVLYAITIFAHVVVGDFSIGFALRCLLLIGGTPYTDILKFYCLVLALAPLLIAFRIRFGLWAIVAIAVTIHLLYPAILSIPPPALFDGKDVIGMGTRFLIGVGDTVVGGPSLVHGLSLVLFGMVIGRAMTDIQKSSEMAAQKGWTLLAGMAAAFFVASATLWEWGQSSAMVAQIANMSLRNANHPLYTALGMSATVSGVMACTYLFDVRRIRALDRWKFIGTVSLFTFAFGNVLLIIQPFTSDNGLEALALSSAFGILIVAQSYLYFTLMKIDQVGGPWHYRSLARLAQGVTKISTDAITRAVKPLSISYSQLVDFLLRPRPRPRVAA